MYPLPSPSGYTVWHRHTNTTTYNIRCPGCRGVGRRHTQTPYNHHLTVGIPPPFPVVVWVLRLLLLVVLHRRLGSVSFLSPRVVFKTGKFMVLHYGHKRCASSFPGSLLPSFPPSHLLLFPPSALPCSQVVRQCLEGIAAICLAGRPRNHEYVCTLCVQLPPPPQTWGEMLCVFWFLSWLLWWLNGWLFVGTYVFF